MLHLAVIFACSIFCRSKIWKTTSVTTLKQNIFWGNPLLFDQFVCQNCPTRLVGIMPAYLFLRWQGFVHNKNCANQIETPEYPAKNSKTSPWNKNHRTKKQKYSFQPDTAQFLPWYGPDTAWYGSDTALIRLWYASDTGLIRPHFALIRLFFWVICWIFFGQMKKWKNSR